MWFREGFQVSPGARFNCPKRNIGSFFEMSELERLSLLALLNQVNAAAAAFDSVLD
jgi:diadenosine tetraphosphate (Ap4A) HIT family hydrolase